MMSRELPPPDLVPPLNLKLKNPYLVSIRILFTLLFLAYMTIVSALAPEFHPTRWLIILAAYFFGLGVGSHYIDVLKDAEYFKTIIGEFSEARMKIGAATGLALGIGLGVYLAYRYSWWFLAFVAVESFFAFSYSAEKPKAIHSSAAFWLGWGFIPSLASYYIQTLRLDLHGVGIAVFMAFYVTSLLHIYEATKTKATAQLAAKVILLNLLAGYIGAIVLLVSRLIH
jgi:hypothetical protein